MNQKMGFVSLVGSAAILGTFGLLVRELANYYSDAGQVMMRSAFASLIIMAIILLQRIKPWILNRAEIWKMALFSVVFPASLFLFTVAANNIKIVNALFMLYVGSILATALFSLLFYRERFTLKHLISLILVLVGLTFFVYPFNLELFSLGLFAGLGAGFLEGTAHTLRRSMKEIKREIIVFYQSISGVVLATLIVLISQETIVREWSTAGLLVALLFGALLIGIGYLLAYGFANINLNVGAIILATELFFAMIVAALFLQEFPTKLEFIGGLLIFGGTVVSGLDLQKKKKPSAEEVVV